MREGGQGGYEQRIEVIVKIAKELRGGGHRCRGGVGGGVRMDAKNESKLL